MYVLSPRRVVEALLRAMRLPDEAFGMTRAIVLPGITASVGEMVDALRTVGGEAAVRRIRWEPDPVIQRIVRGWPARIDAERARRMGFEADRSFEEIVRAHVEDELGGRVAA
jgi:D-erythronate 2-dehydrogenase